jgi:hypothetical protein
MEYEPEGLIEKVGDALHIIERQAEGDLARFKEFIESERYATGAWRGSVNEGIGVGTPTIEDAAASQGDSGKAGISGKAMAAGAAVAAAGVAAAAMTGKKDESEAELGVPRGAGDAEIVEVVEVVDVVDVPAAEPVLDLRETDPTIAGMPATDEELRRPL